jgi:hypothetical protein
MIIRFLLRTVLFWLAGRIFGRFLPGLHRGWRIFRR